MVGVTIFLFGFLIGALCMWWVQILARTNARHGEVFASGYEPAKRVVKRALRVQGTLNIWQLERMLDVSGPVALRYLDQMVTDGILKQQGHRGHGAFYTLVVG